MKFELDDKQIEFLIRTLMCSYGEREGDFDKKNICDRGLMGELLAIFDRRCSIESFQDACNQRTLEVPIRQKLFMGAGWCSQVNANQLHRRLQYAVHELGALEQNGGQGTEFDEKMEQECRQNIKDVLEDIRFAFDID